MNSQSVLLVILLCVIFYASYSAYSLKTRIFCSFRKADKTLIEKWAKVNQRRIIFEGGVYYVNPKRTYTMLLTKGIHQILPIWIRRSDYRWDSSQPLDPETFENKWETPEARLNLNKQEDIEALAKGNRISLQTKQKKGMLESYMPLITIGGFALIGYVIYTLIEKIDMLGMSVNVLQQMMQQFMK